MIDQTGHNTTNPRLLTEVHADKQYESQLGKPGQAWGIPDGGETTSRSRGSRDQRLIVSCLLSLALKLNGGRGLESRVIINELQ
jgi:hypothetical protein